MPTEQEIQTRQAELVTIADEVRTQINLTATKTTAINSQMESVENLKAGLLNTILNDRFEINNKLKYTNDDQRRAALIALRQTDADYQAAQTALWTLEEEKKIAEAEAEYQRKLYRANELALLFLANNPA